MEFGDILLYAYNGDLSGIVSAGDIMNTPKPILGNIFPKTGADPGSGIGAMVTVQFCFVTYSAAEVVAVSVIPSSFFTSGAMSVSAASSK